MKIVAVTVAALALWAAAPAAAEAKPGGCLKYGLGGAVAGHFAGGHRWKGAAAGCVLGIIQRRRSESAQQQQVPPRRMDREERRDRNEDRVARDHSRNSDPEETGSVRRRGDFQSEGTFARPRERSY
jgi:hypothetical protein